MMLIKSGRSSSSRKDSNTVMLLSPNKRQSILSSSSLGGLTVTALLLLLAISSISPVGADDNLGDKLPATSTTSSDNIFSHSGTAKSSAEGEEEPLLTDTNKDNTLFTKRRHDAFIYSIKEAHHNGSRRRTTGDEDGGSSHDAPDLPLIWKDTDRLLVQVSSTQPNAEVTLRLSLESAVDFETVACSKFTCSGYLNITLLDDAEALASVMSIKPSIAMLQGTFGSGSLVSGAMFAHTIDKIVQKYPYLDGSGIKIGVLSDSYDTSLYARSLADDDIASGDLPPSGVEVLKDFYSGDTIDEGRAMLQLIHDIAPGAELAFYTAYESEDDFAAGIWTLADAGCDVIVDDISYLTEPFFQEGIIAQAANDVAALYGVPYFSSAGNDARKSWEGAFVNSGIEVAPGCFAHDFGGGNIRQAITAAADTMIVLQWDQPFYSVSGYRTQNDLDFHLFERGTSNLEASSVEDNLSSGDPIEWLQVPESADYDLIICKYVEGPDPGLMKWIGVGGSVQNVNPATDSSTVFGHPNAPYVAGIGAAFDMQLFSELVLEPFSSAGGTPLLFERDGTRKASPEILRQPRFVGFDGSLNTFFGQPTDNYWPLYKGIEGYLFFGTSAAAPNVAAIAAIMLQANPSLTPLKVYSIMEDTAIDMLEPGFDFDSGYGVVSGLECVELAIGQKKAKISSRPYCSSYTSGTAGDTPSSTGGGGKKPKVSKKRRALGGLQVEKPGTNC